ncbi:hypothetical protein BASA81_007067 [Batrachochytrium salamandrivorans]|nr:hypothetical protein BASA81_007067 [Batrachochytrium salamandrivorans]
MRRVLVARRFLSSTPPGKADLSIPTKTNPGADLSSLSRAVVHSRDEQIRELHERIPDSLETRKKRLIWRSKQRGLLEVDLLLGTWALKNIPQMTSVEQLDQYEHLLNMETIDMFNVISKPEIDMSTVPMQGAN